jgi:hypothetical protein
LAVAAVPGRVRMARLRPGSEGRGPPGTERDRVGGGKPTAKKQRCGLAAGPMPRQAPPYAVAALDAVDSPKAGAARPAYRVALSSSWNCSHHSGLIMAPAPSCATLPGLSLGSGPGRGGQDRPAGSATAGQPEPRPLASSCGCRPFPQGYQRPLHRTSPLLGSMKRNPRSAGGRRMTRSVSLVSSGLDAQSSRCSRRARPRRPGIAWRRSRRSSARMRSRASML